jgi:hypothetical protein
VEFRIGLRLDSIDRSVRKRSHSSRYQTEDHRLPGRQLDVLVLWLILDGQPFEFLVCRKVHTCITTPATNQLRLNLALFLANIGSSELVRGLALVGSLTQGGQGDTSIESSDTFFFNDRISAMRSISIRSQSRRRISYSADVSCRA